MEGAQPLPAGPPLALGRTAEVYAWGDRQVLKLFPAGAAEAAVEHEARIGRIVAEAGIGAPAVGGVITAGNRRGIVYSRVAGSSMLMELMRQPWRVVALARIFGRLHATMHTVHRPQLPAQRANLLRDIAAAPGLTPPVREAVANRLASLDDGDAVCHGDYHPDNILMSAAGPVIIDWVTAGHGNPDADVARTVLLLSLGEPLQMSYVQRGMIFWLRRLLLGGYLRSYRSLRACPQTAIAEWLPVVAAARLREGIAQETPRLLALAEQAID